MLTEAVFLRILEYYSGILFLTTNRVGAIDDAFRSRIHLTLYYPKLTKGMATKIFKKNFERIADINTERTANHLPPFEVRNPDKVVEWVTKSKNWDKLRWNGRQIRNAFQTVLALAEFDAKRKESGASDRKGPVVTKDHFKIVANASVQFNEYLKETRGFDEDRVAKRDLARAETFSAKVGLPSDSSSDSSGSSGSGKSDKAETDGDTGSNSSESGLKNKKKKKKSKSKKGKDGKKKHTAKTKGKSEKKRAKEESDDDSD